MWKLDNPVIIVLVSLLSGCIIYYLLSGAIIGILISFIIVIYTCIVLLSDDSLVTRHAFLLFNYLRDSGIEFYELLNKISVKTSGNVLKVFEAIKGIWRNQILDRMDRRRNTYQLSSESFVNSRNSGDFESLKGLSPIPKKVQSENNVFSRYSAAYESPRGFDKVTSTPMTSWRHQENGDVHAEAKIKRNSMKKEEFEGNCVNSPRDEEIASPWGTSISPKIRQRAGGVKTVQTIAGPLLASTRYNIDTKTYADVTSPGLSSRLTKYATEANSKLIHSQYATGQFPRVNLSSSPTPLINSKTGKMRLPVTVRVAPPDTINNSPRKRQETFVRMYQTKNSKATPSVAQVLKEISLKRHASREDIAAELIKKQRTDGIYSDELENLEEMTQKRGREESSKSEEDISIDNSTSRPSKRTKKPSCYDIINSLSSSTNVSSGVKRKADISRSGTPEVGKHFKSFDSTLNASGSPKIHPELVKMNKIDGKTSIETSNSSKGTPDAVSPKGILKVTKESPSKSGKIDEIPEEKSPKVEVPVKLTDRLFMREEPQNIDKLKTLINEHSSIRKFSGPDGDEIKKSDIVNMRQTSMKAKLKSMFDAISGKTASKIDPNVVIQAETVIPASASSPPSLTTLSSSTSTTNVNTSPISTSALVPIIGKSKSPGTPAKHVRWNLPDSSSIAGSSGPQQSTESEKKIGESEKPVITLSSFTSPTTSAPPVFSFGASVPSTSISTSLGGGFGLQTTPATSAPKFEAPVTVSAPQTTQTPTFSFGTSSATALPVSTSQNTTPNVPQLPTSTAVPTTTISSLFGGTPKSETSFAPTPTISTAAVAPTTSSSTSTSMFSLGASGTGSKGFSFGATTTVASTTAIAPTTTVTSTPASNGNFTFGANTINPTPPTTTTQSGFAFGANTPTSSIAPISTATTTATAPIFSFGGTPSTTNQSFSTNSFGSTTAKPVFSFGATSSQAPATTLTFAAPTPSVPSTSAPTLSFGAPTTSAPSVFGTPSTTAPVFGTSSGTTPTPAFGTPSTTASTPAFSTQSTSSFGSTSAPIFGAAVSTQSPAPTGTLSFGAPKTTATAFGTTTTTSSSLFNGASTTATTSSSIFSGGGIFGQSKPPPAFGATTTANSGFGAGTNFGSTLFGSQPTTTAGFGTNSTTTTTFGAANTSAPGFGAQTALPVFGNPTTTASGFGTSSTAPSFGAGAPPAFGAQNSSSSLFNSTTPSFGGITTTTAAPPAFGTATASTSGFGNAPPAFGSTNPPPPAFGNTSTSFSGFGTSGNNAASPFGSTAPSFGAPSTSAPAFRGTGTSLGGGFAFGSTPSSSTQAQPQQNSMFSFGSGGTSSGFQFNSTTPQTGGFNFTGSPAPGTSGTSFSSPSPAFGGSGSGGMFSIGSGSTAPRSRSARQGRKQR